MESEKEIKKIDKAIQELVYEKISLQKAYNYYHGYRDPEQYRHLEENYGIGVPTSISFTPLIKKHIDVLIGEYLGLDPDLKISCKDSETVSNILREKHLKINNTLYAELNKYLNNNLISILTGDKKVIKDPYIEKQLENIKIDIDNTFISDYEIAAQNILKYLRQSRNIDLKNKMRDLFSDLLISGTCYYKTGANKDDTNVELEILNPLNTFIERNPNSYYLSDSRRCVIRKYMTKEDIINKYINDLSKEAIDKLDSLENSINNHSNAVYVRIASGTEVSGNVAGTPGILGGLEIHPTIPLDGSRTIGTTNNLIVVHYVEWLEIDNKTGVLTRHDGIKIGNDIYITNGESKHIIRSIDDKSKCKLSINGTFFLDKNGNPFSLMLSTMTLQDKYDLLTFYRDNLIASSGTVGDWIDIASIPEALGVDLPDRLQKWHAYKKNGAALFDSSQEGANIINTTFNGFDDTVKAASIQAIQIAIQSIEQQASSITGVLPEKLAQYEQRDAVTNVQLGVKMSGLLTKQYFEILDIMYKEINYDLLNLAKIVYKKGITGTIILGDKYSNIFTALPEHYTMTDYDLHIEDSTATYHDREVIKAMGSEFIKAGIAEPDMIFNIMASKNMTELRRYTDKAVKLKKEENNVIQQLQQQLQELQNQSKQLEQQLTTSQNQAKQLEQQISKNGQVQLKLDQEKLRIEQEKNKNQDAYNNKLLDIKEQQLKAEIYQMTDNNPYNDKIKN